MVDSRLRIAYGRGRVFTATVHVVSLWAAVREYPLAATCFSRGP
jgi:hypothetical protein